MKSAGSEVNGLPEGVISVSLFMTNPTGKPAISPLGYHLSPRNRCVNPALPGRLEGRLNHDINDLTILLEPGERPDQRHVPVLQLDPTRVADFNDAKAGPITGVPPEDFPGRR